MGDSNKDDREGGEKNVWQIFEYDNGDGDNYGGILATNSIRTARKIGFILLKKSFTLAPKTVRAYLNLFLHKYLHTGIDSSLSPSTRYMCVLQSDNLCKLRKCMCVRVAMYMQYNLYTFDVRGSNIIVT